MNLKKITKNAIFAMFDERSEFMSSGLNATIKGQIKSKAGLARRRFSQKKNELI